MDQQQNREVIRITARVPRITLLLVVFLAAAGLWSALSIRFQSELLPLFPQHLPSVQALKRLQQTQASEREIVLVPDRREGADMGDAQAALDRLEEALSTVGTVQRGPEINPQAAVAMVAGWLVQIPPEPFTRAAAALDPATAEKRLQAARENLAGVVEEESLMRFRLDPLGVLDAVLPGGSFPALSQEKTRVVRLTVPEEVKTFDACSRVTSRVRNVVDAAVRGTSLEGRMLMTGHPAFTAEISSRMRQDMFVMLLFAMGLTTGAFLLFYRSARPLLAIVGIQILGVLVAFAVAYAAFGQLNVLSIAFSSILLGVGMDYCILVYHHFALGQGLETPHWHKLRRAIWLSSATTAAAFGLLGFSSFPGLQQLAVLVGVGLLATGWLATSLLAWWLSFFQLSHPVWLVAASEAVAGRLAAHRQPLRIVLFLGLLAGALFFPVMAKHAFYDPELAHLQPRHLEAYRAQQILVQQQKEQWPLLAQVDASQATGNRRLWQTGRAPALKEIFDRAGFQPDWSAPTLELVGLLDRWKAGEPAGPKNAAEWWVQLRSDLNATALADFRRLSVWMGLGMVALCLAIHRSVRLAALNILALLLSLALLGALLAGFQISMTLMSLLCIPLLIGLVIDISLHLLLGLEQHGGNLPATFRAMAAPVVLTGITAAAGFGAPMLSSQPALQNFGLVMDLGIFSAVFAGLVLLPILYVGTHQTRHYSWLYGAGWFEIMARVAACLPRRCLLALGWIAGVLGGAVRWRGCAVVRANQRLLLPGIADRRLAWRTYVSFTQTLADYFYLARRQRHHAAALIQHRVGREYFEQVHQQGKGCLLVTPHFGFFELGGVLLCELGYSVVALTQQEPSVRLGQWRNAYRQRWGMETQEIGHDPFSFIQAANHLRNNKFVVALIDRPHPTQSVSVRLPGGEARISGGILLLAESVGCPVIVGTVVRQKNNLYHLVARPPFTIEKKETSAETVRYYSQKIMDDLLGELCQYPEQWYQFVPLSS